MWESQHVLERLLHKTLAAPGHQAAPLARERHLAWINDKKILRARHRRVAPQHEITSGDGSRDLFPTVCLLPEVSASANAPLRRAVMFFGARVAS